MMGFKKKLTSFLPSDTQNRLQNVLTVEWEGQGKTVLVELPDSNRSRNDSNEVEMAGLTSNGSTSGFGYGRLNDDDDDDERSYSRPSRSDYHSSNQSSSSASKHRKYPSYSSKTLPPLPSRSSHPIHHTNGGGLTNNSAQIGYINQNPFEPEYNSPQPSSSSTYSNSPYTNFTPQFQNQSTFANEGYNNSSLGRGKKTMPNPWGNKFRADDIDFLGDLGGGNISNDNVYSNGGNGNSLNSPTSSSGRYSQQSNSNSLENPFR